MHPAPNHLHKASARRPGRTSLWMALALLQVGCGNPCRDLSEKICQCLPTAERRTQCVSQINVLAGQWNSNPNSPSHAAGDQEAAGQRRCMQLLETCTCDKLQAGDLAACGLANESASP